MAQCLQRLHGGRERWVRNRGTLFALSRLRDKGLLSGAEYGRLASAYEFLRLLEHRLQFYDDRQIHTLPADKKSLEILARKMPMGVPGETVTADSLIATLERRLGDVQDIYERVIHTQKPMYYSTPASSDEALTAIEPEAPGSASSLTRFLDQRAPGLAAVVARAELRRSRERFEYFLEKVLAAPELLAALDGNPSLVESVIDVFEHSQYFGDQLIRTPELVFELEADVGDGGCRRRRRLPMPSKCGGLSGAPCSASSARASCGARRSSSHWNAPATWRTPLFPAPTGWRLPK